MGLLRLFFQVELHGIIPLLQDVSHEFQLLQLSE